MLDKELDPNLQAPQEANTTKHFNFLEAEEAADTGENNDRSDANDDSPTKKAWEELRKEQSRQQDVDRG